MKSMCRRCPVGEDRSATFSEPQKICLLGSGNWGSVIAIIVGENALRYPHIHDTVKMYVREGEVDGRQLSDIINEEHENVKYLPGHKLPENILAVSNIVEAVRDADGIIFVIPHQFIVNTCEQIAGKIKSNAHALSLIKGFHSSEDGEIELISHVIGRLLSIEVSVLMGANLANELANKCFSEVTLGCDNKNIAPLWVDLMQNDYFEVAVTEDKTSVEIYSALKNVVAVAAGLIDGLGFGFNTKSTVMRLGMLEMIRFVDLLYPGGKIATFFASCGVADVITSCSGGRNRNVAELFVRNRKSMTTLERMFLHGQKLQGPDTAAEVNTVLKERNMESRFPIMTAVYRICTREMEPEELIDVMKTVEGNRLELINTK